MYKKTYQNTKPSIPDAKKYDSSKQGLILRLRERRIEECFKVVNRGRLWYNRLTDEQYAQLEIWYQAWLDVTETLKAPEPLEWLNDKLETEDII